MAHRRTGRRCATTATTAPRRIDAPTRRENRDGRSDTRGLASAAVRRTVVASAMPIRTPPPPEIPSAQGRHANGQEPGDHRDAEDEGDRRDERRPQGRGDVSAVRRRADQHKVRGGRADRPDGGLREPRGVLLRGPVELCGHPGRVVRRGGSEGSLRHHCRREARGRGHDLSDLRRGECGDGIPAQLDGGALRLAPIDDLHEGDDPPRWVVRVHGGPDDRDCRERQRDEERAEDRPPGTGQALPGAGPVLAAGLFAGPLAREAQPEIRSIRGGCRRATSARASPCPRSEDRTRRETDGSLGTGATSPRNEPAHLRPPIFDPKRARCRVGWGRREAMLKTRLKADAPASSRSAEKRRDPSTRGAGKWSTVASGSWTTANALPATDSLIEIAK